MVTHTPWQTIRRGVFLWSEEPGACAMPTPIARSVPLRYDPAR
ncbi:MAG TPA: hypothetical protein PKD09_06705 [Aggregatilinea sp.]|nr:hypothetical protein [Aggregatilinea sp.]HML21316.1 hypothetical protein [Aggregatilinea sp.]